MFEDNNFEFVLQITIWDFVDKANASEGQQWSRGQVKIPKASMFTVSEMFTVPICSQEVRRSQEVR